MNFGIIRFFLLMSVFVLADSSHAFAQERVKQRPSFLELSVKEGEIKELKIIWRIGTGDRAQFKAYLLRAPFGFEWLAPPAGATAFVAHRTDYMPIDADFNWIEIDFVRAETSSEAFTYHLPFKNTDLILNQTMIDRNKADPLLWARCFPIAPKTKEGWCYVGSWNPEKTTWNTIFWSPAETVATRSTRTDCTSPPSLMVGQKLAVNFPLRVRSGPSSSNPLVEKDATVHPGAMAIIKEIYYDTSVLDRQGIWAKITVEDKPVTLEESK